LAAETPPGDYRLDTNRGRGWRSIVRWKQPLWEGDDGIRVTHHLLLGQAVRHSLQIGCCAGVRATEVVRADQPDEVVLAWDTETNRFEEDGRITAFEQLLSREDLARELARRSERRQAS
jgi:hypothetical protein